jgi:predicted membrane metal-binding protein
MFAAFAVFISVDLLLWLAVPGLPGLMTRLGLATLLSAIALLLITGLFVIIKLIIVACFDHFSARQRLQRRLLFIQAKQDQLKQLFYFRTVQINYFNELKRKRLLSANNRQHIRSLSKAIDKDLQSIKQQLSKTTYLQLQQENVQYRNQQDIEALLKLQQKIATIA